MAANRLKTWIWQRERWPEFTWDLAALAGRLAAARGAQGRISAAGSFLTPSLGSNAQLDMLTAEGVATSAIEGESLDPRQLRSSLARQLGLPFAGLPKPSRSSDELARLLIDAVREPERALTLKRLCTWHAMLFETDKRRLIDIRVGALRGPAPMQIVSGPIGRERVHYEAPPQSVLLKQLRLFINWFNHPPRDLDGLIRAGLAHGWFEILHPFEDGNGRVGRAVLDRALAQDDACSSPLYSLSSRFLAERDGYYDALNRLSRGDLDVTEWMDWFLRQLALAMHEGESTLGRVVAKARFWALNSERGLSDRQRKALNALLDAPPSGFEGGMTNRKYARLTRVSPATAQRDLAELAAAGILRPRGSGRSVSYELAALE